MSSCHDKRRNRGGRQSGTHGVLLLGVVDLAMPLPPGLGWREHATSAAHVTERTLSGAAGTSSTHTGDTGDGASGTPRARGDVLSGVDVDGVGLAGVFGHVDVYEAD
mmetsp:Transcript_40515/g.48589  ORF Transcript_40515/g.48589 Transcript_40515/m.48589 type:complete len:107 (-) Transcript_40515:212-532(-)